MIFIQMVRNTIITLLVLSVVGCQKQDKPNAVTVVSEGIVLTTKKMGVVSQSFSLDSDASGNQTHPESKIEFSKSGNTVAYIEPVGDKNRVVFGSRIDKTYTLVSDITISGDGTRTAYFARNDPNFIRIVLDGWEGPLFNDIEAHMFSLDGKHYVYTARQNDETRIVVDNKIHYDYKKVSNPFLNKDSNLVAFSNKGDSGKSSFIISDLVFSKKTVLESCGEYAVASRDKSRLAVTCEENGKSSIKLFDFVNRSVLSTIPVDGKVIRLGVAADNTSVVYVYFKTEGGENYVGLNGKVEMIPKGDVAQSNPLLLTAPDGVGVIIGDAYKVRMFYAFQGASRHEQIYPFITDFVSSGDGKHHAYVVSDYDNKQHIVVDGHAGQKFDKIIDPLFSNDGTLLTYRTREAGRRFIVVSDTGAAIVRKLPDYDMVFRPVFLPDGNSIGFGVLDKNELWWKVEKLR